jgi:hypothetical protein
MTWGMPTTYAAVPTQDSAGRVAQGDSPEAL